MVQLTKLVKTSGCAAKLPVGKLEEVLSSIKMERKENLLVGFETSDDALVYDLEDGRVLIETVDFFPPVADDPYTFGAISAANSISDIYAMGGEPSVAMNITLFPSCMDLGILKNIILGARDKAMEAGVVIAGGHTISDESIKFGLAVTGFAQKDRFWRNCGAHDGDVLVLTKKIGIGIINMAAKADECSSSSKEEALSSMLTLNKRARDIAIKYDVHAATDITGFSLLGHIYEMASSSSLSFNLDFSSVPHIKEAIDAARLGFIPSGAYSNREYLESKVENRSGLKREEEDLLFDPQTSGGLALAMKKEDALSFISEFGSPAGIIGTFSRKRDKTIYF